MTTATIHVDAVLNLPLDDGGTLPLRQGIAAHPTGTPGLVVFPALTGFMGIDDSTWHITHVPSGRRIPVGFTNRDSAEGYATALGALGDWTPKKPTVSPLEVLRLAVDHGATIDTRYEHIDLSQ